jgi:aquaporin Z
MNPSNKTPLSFKKYYAEAIGTFALVFAGTGAIVVNQLYGGVITHLGVALSFGLIVMTMIYSLGDVSGAHLNPAVTVAFWTSKRFPGKEVLPYCLCQILGACMASTAILFLFPESSQSIHLGATQPSGSLVQSFVMETLLTLFLMFVILHVSTGAKEKGIIAGAAVGGIVALEALFAGPVSGASMNPARSIGPALLSWVSGSGNAIPSLWIYIIAPVLGAQIAVLNCRISRTEGCCTDC